MNIDLLLSHPYVSQDVKLEFHEYPFRHFVLKNLFKSDIYESMREVFPKYISRCPKPHGAVGSSNLFYDALIYSMKNEDCVNGWDFFAERKWQQFVSSVFNLQFNDYAAYTLHYHAGSLLAPSKNGWPHLDLSICSMAGSAKSENYLNIIDGGEYADDSWNRQPNSPKALRSVAMLFYLDNNSNGVGGGTGIYESYDVNSLIKQINPENNSLFAFEIGPNSFHGYIGANYNRSAMVQWFHGSPSQIIHSNLEKFKQKWKRDGKIFEHWKNQSLWQLEMDPDYSKYFAGPISKVLEQK